MREGEIQIGVLSKSLSKTILVSLGKMVRLEDFLGLFIIFLLRPTVLKEGSSLSTPTLGREN